MSAPPNTSGPIQFGQYTLERKLAEGGMAEVFLAHQRGFGGFEKQVVVKRILPSLSTHAEFVQMFLNEARLAARLSHGNVVQVIEAGEIDGQYYIAMEYIEGCDLKPFYDEAERTGLPIPPGIACRIIADLLAGLHYAHTLTDENGRSLGIVHRDVSPQNVLITRTGNVKIVDFGIAKATHSATQQTRVGQVKGKISYMSPEQAMGRALDARSDVFACGILLWELCTGARLFSRANDMAAIIAITDDDRPNARSVRPELPAALDALLSQALARPLDQRYASAQAMQRDLEVLIRSQGWAGDRRTLERYMQQRLGGMTPEFGAPYIEDPSEPPLGDEPMPTEERLAVEYGEGPTTMGSPIDIPTEPQSSLQRTGPQSTFDDGPTVMGSPTDFLPPPPHVHNENQPVSAHDAATLSLNAHEVALAAAQRSAQVVTAPQRTVQRTPSKMSPVPPVEPQQRMPQRTPSGMLPLPPTQAPHASAYRTPSGMRQMPPQPLPPQPQPSGIGRRIAVASIAALLAGGALVFALTWHGRPTGPQVSTMQAAHVLVELSEPGMVELDGKHVRMTKSGELLLGVGHQATLTATTTRGNGAEVTRSISLPPAREGEKIPVKIVFP